MSKGILTLLAGYAAGLAIAMKYKKDHKKHDTDSSMLDDIIEIHKTVFDTAKKSVQEFLDGIETPDDLKTKVMGVVDTFVTETKSTLSRLDEATADKRSALLEKTESLFVEKTALIDMAKEKWVQLQKNPQDTMNEWATEAKEKLSQAYKEFKKYSTQGTQK